MDNRLGESNILSREMNTLNNAVQIVTALIAKTEEKILPAEFDKKMQEYAVKAVNLSNYFKTDAYSDLRYADIIEGMKGGQGPAAPQQKTPATFTAVCSKCGQQFQTTMNPAKWRSPAQCPACYRASQQRRY